MGCKSITGDMLISDVLAKLPESAEIMEDFGLHCTSCSFGAFEPLKEGAMAHGLPEEKVDEMIEKINELAKCRKRTASKDSIYLTEKAAQKVIEFAAAEGKESFLLRITAEDNDGMEPAYQMDFVEEVFDEDSSFEFHGVKIIMNKTSFNNLTGSDIDFLETKYGSGFKIDNPNFKEGCCGGACGSGNC